MFPMLFTRTITFLMFSLLLSCTYSENVSRSSETRASSIVCEDGGCSGVYDGPEFVGGDDVAHQFSNQISEKVGDKLKELYRNKVYSKVDFDGIEMSTHGMGSGTVVYQLTIPFKTVTEKCDAYTSFDHVGGWNHAPALAARKRQLQKALMNGETLDISRLKKTPEGLEEYWIQWKNNTEQAECQQ